MIVLSILAVIVVITCASVIALTWILIGAEIEERRRKENDWI